MPVLVGDRPPQKQKGRAVLTVRDPLVESLLRGLEFEGLEVSEYRAFCKSLVRDRNAYDISKRRRGLFGGLSKSDADAALRRLLAEAVDA